MPVKILENLSANANTANYVDTLGVRTSVLDTSNIRFVRNLKLSNSGLSLTRGSNTIAIPMSQILALFASNEPNVTWPPVIGTQPSAANVAAPNATSFSVAASAETAVTYQWQRGANNTNYTNVSNGGVYSNCTTNHINISNTTGLNNNYYRCLCINASGTTTSNAALLLVT